MSANNWGVNLGYSQSIGSTLRRPTYSSDGLGVACYRNAT